MSVRLNPTGVKRFGRCEAEWTHHSVSQIFPLRRRASEHRDRGSVFHALLEHALRCYAKDGRVGVYEGEDGRLLARAVALRLWDEERVSVSDEVMWELWRAAVYQLEQLRLTEWEVVYDSAGEPLIERDMRGSLPDWPDPVEVQARVDVVLRHRASGKVWLVDFKTTTYPISVLDVPAFVEHDDQLLIGRLLLESIGVQVDFAALLHLRSHAPTEPPTVYTGTARERLI